MILLFTLGAYISLSHWQFSDQLSVPFAQLSQSSQLKSSKILIMLSWIVQMKDCIRVEAAVKSLPEKVKFHLKCLSQQRITGAVLSKPTHHLCFLASLQTQFKDLFHIPHEHLSWSQQSSAAAFLQEHVLGLEARRRGATENRWQRKQQDGCEHPLLPKNCQGFRWFCEELSESGFRSWNVLTFVLPSRGLV